MNSPRRVLVIFNPTAGWRRRERFGQFHRALVATGCAVTVRETTGPGHATRIAAQADTQGFDVVAVAGGDGTINEAVNGLAGGRAALAIVPLGTANVLAHELGILLDMADCADLVARGAPRAIHLGRINGRCFTMMAGVGFDAHVVRRVTPSFKRRVGKLAYVVHSIGAMIDYRLGEYEVLLDGAPRRAASAVIAKGRSYGGSYTCAPDARLADPWFYVCLFRSGGGWNALRYATGLLAGRLAGFEDIEIVRAREVRIDGRADEPVQADGEIVTTLPAVATIVSEPLSVIAPGAA